MKAKPIYAPRRGGLGRALRIVGFTLMILTGAAIAGSGGSRPAIMLTLDGAVSPATGDYIRRGLDEAASRNAALVILKMDTPGGLASSMRDIIHDILASPVPVAGYVAPSGSRAASAGTYIMYASHVAAMAPSTHLGAATPVQIGGGGGLPFGGGQQEEKEPQPGATDGGDGETSSGEGGGSAPKSASEAKAINDAVAYIRSLAELRGRNADWAESAVREAASMTSTRAAEENVIDFIAANPDDLLRQADGMTVRLGENETTLNTAGLAIESIEPDWRNRLLSIITDPNMALIFMMIGIYGLIFEFMNPGTMVPGTIGAICLLLGLYSLAVLPVSYAGAGLMFLGLALIVAEMFAPSFGILGLGGAAAFVLGATILFDPAVPGMGISWPVIGGVAAAAVILALLVSYLAVGSSRRRVVTGREEMIGVPAQVLDWSGEEGHVHVHGERWKASADRAFEEGDRVRITGIDGLVLTVEADGGSQGDETA
jgi:membrane-bound serine protease (ClpP class)